MYSMSIHLLTEPNVTARYRATFGITLCAGGQSFVHKTRWWRLGTRSERRCVEGGSSWERTTCPNICSCRFHCKVEAASEQQTSEHSLSGQYSKATYNAASQTNTMPLQKRSMNPVVASSTQASFIRYVLTWKPCSNYYLLVSNSRINCALTKKLVVGAPIVNCLSNSHFICEFIGMLWLGCTACKSKHIKSTLL